MSGRNGRTWSRKHYIYHKIEKALGFDSDPDIVSLLQLPEQCLEKLEKAISKIIGEAME